MQAVQEERVPFLYRRVTRYLALISRRQGECESDARAAGSGEEEPSGDLASPELLDFFLTPSPATGSEVTGRGSFGAERAFVKLEGSEQGPRGGRPKGREGSGAERGTRASISSSSSPTKQAHKAPSPCTQDVSAGLPPLPSKPAPVSVRSLPRYLIATFPSE